MPRCLFALLFTALFFTACTTNNVTVDDSLQKHFDSAGVKGTFGLFDNGQGHFTIYNLPRFRDSAYQPAGTFGIVQALIALQTGGLSSDSAHIVYGPWTDKQEGTDTGSKKLPLLPTLVQAFQNDGYDETAGFVILARYLGKDTLKKWVDSLHYGNRDMSGPADSFWFNNRLKITADEQLGLTKRLYFDQLPFFNRPQRLVRSMMLAQGNSNYRLVYKTGQGINAEGHALGWILGWEEENKHPYFFVINLESADTSKDLSVTGLHIVKSILRPMGFFEGKK